MAIFWPFFGPPRILFWVPEWPSAPPAGGSGASLEACRGGREGGTLKAYPRSRARGDGPAPVGARPALSAIAAEPDPKQGRDRIAGRE